ncbi:hypothetical protein TI39_contig373g00012 [Zymoseptoria brevis]|uniref:Uncharacterized protein n=1 Tax=Zymoseptoria brevis TaxID=1047168 RepID=A0A0F4GNV8_9PEZI|nr:hypothetical protein TI39_contig373g00012 [Zymoseptoria brevis]
MSRGVNGIKGGFVSIPSAFKGVPEGSKHVFKLELVPKLVETRNLGKVDISTNVDIISHRVLFDFAEFDVDDVDYDRLGRDCDLLKEAFRSRRKELNTAMKAVSNTGSTPEEIRDIAKMLDEAGLSERAFLENDGGILPLLAIGAALLLSGCVDIKINEK